MNLRSVVMLNDAAHVDGGGSQVGIAEAVGLARRGVDVAFVAATGPIDPDLASSVSVTCTNQGKITESGGGGALSGAALQGLWNRRAAEAVRATLSERDPNTTVVHAHGWTKALSSSALRAATRAGFPVVVTLHDYFTACPNGSYYDHRAGRICRRRAMSAACVVANCDSRTYPTKLYRVARQVVQRNAGGVPATIKHYISISHFSRNVVAPYLPQRARVHPVRNPIDATPGPPVDVATNSPFLYVGRLSPEKGAAFLASAARAAGVPLVVVGEGSERERIAQLNPSTVFDGWLSRDAVRERLRGARALVLPSLWQEPFGIVVLEAAALGVPAIVPDETAASELVIDGTTGLIFPTGSEDGLVQALRRLQDDAFVAALGKQAHATYWADPATLDAHLDALLGVYEEVLAD